MSFIIWKERFFRQWRAVWGRLERRFRKFRKETPENQKASLEKQFLERWTTVLMERADVFNGLYGGLLRVQEGTAKKKGEILSEWWLVAPDPLSVGGAGAGEFLPSGI